MMTWLLGCIAGLFVLALVVSAYVIGNNHGRHEERNSTIATQPVSPPEANPAGDLFVANCGTCHTLAAADTSGTVGPNLDDLQPDQALVLTTIQNGAGSGAMPANLLTGSDAQQVAAYVAASAGH